MDEQAYERMPDEPHRWYSRFLLYRDMGPARSVLGAENIERVTRGHEKSHYTSGGWREAAKTWQWRTRAEAWDEEQQREALASTKYALVSERAKLLDRWISTQDTIMVAQVADKGYARADALEQLRGLLDDMAKEVGGRVKLAKQELTGKDGGPIAFSTEWGGGALEADDDEGEA